ncbi:hypothetical protein KIPB_011720, partial [Kipferlia bialata]
SVSFSSHLDIENIIWQKLLANVACNCVAAMTGLTSIHILADRSTRTMLEGLAEEVAQVARVKGLSFPALDDPKAYVVAAFAGTKDNKVSMLQDIEAGRPTEIGTLNEAVVREAQALGVRAPLNEMVTQVIRGKELFNRLAKSAA